MDGAQFDNFAEEYELLHARNIRVSGEDPAFFAKYKVEDVKAVMSQDGRNPSDILDFGAGVGVSVEHWRAALPHARLVCLDVSQRCVDLARGRHGAAAEFHVYDGSRIPFEDRSFDVVFAACVFHHIPAEEQGSLLIELRRVLRVDGTLFIFEHNPLNPLTVHAVNTCEFDFDAVLIRSWTMRRRVKAAGFRRISVAYRVFFPRMLRALRPLERLLRRVPFGAQYRLAAQP